MTRPIRVTPPTKPAKPLNGNIVVKRTQRKPTEEELNEAPKKDKKGRPVELPPIEVDVVTEIYDTGNLDMSTVEFKVGDLVNLTTYGTEVITAEEKSDTHDICYALVGPGQVSGVYE